MKEEKREFNYNLKGNDKNLYLYIESFKGHDHIARFTITEPINTFEDLKRLLHEAVEKGLTEIEEEHIKREANRKEA